MKFAKVIVAALLSYVLSGILNVIVLFIAKAAGVSMIVPHGREGIKEVMQPADIFKIPALFFIVGGLAVWVVAKIAKRAPWPAAIIVMVIGFLITGFPILGSAIDPPTKAVLVVMHLIGVAAFYILLKRMTRRGQLGNEGPALRS